MGRKRKSLLEDFCDKCKRKIPHNEGKVNSWQLFCNSCYDDLVKLGKIEPLCTPRSKGYQHE